MLWRSESPNRLHALLDDLAVAQVVFMEECREAGLARALRLLESGPAGEEVAEHHGVLIAEPIEHLRKILLEGVGYAIGNARGIADQGATLLDQTLQGAHCSFAAAAQ